MSADKTAFITLKTAVLIAADYEHDPIKLAFRL
jgi:hypothetical protein